MNKKIQIKKIISTVIIIIFAVTFSGCFFLEKGSETSKEKKEAVSTTKSNSNNESKFHLDSPTSTTTTSATSTTSTSTSTTSSSTSTSSSTTLSTSTTSTTKKKSDQVTYINGVLVANKSYSLPKTYAPGVNSTAKAAFDRLAADAKGEGVELWIRSGYRSYDYQANLYNNYVKRDGKKAADTYSARPGHSEHQTGLAFDINSLSTSFGETKEGKWLAQNCWKYGFIIRYPKGKESITGYQYEPWHIRYLGKEKAKAIYNSGLTLEEYLGINSKYSD